MERGRQCVCPHSPPLVQGGKLSSAAMRILNMISLSCILFLVTESACPCVILLRLYLSSVLLNDCLFLMILERGISMRKTKGPPTIYKILYYISSSVISFNTYTLNSCQSIVTLLKNMSKLLLQMIKRSTKKIYVKLVMLEYHLKRHHTQPLLNILLSRKIRLIAQFT